MDVDLLDRLGTKFTVGDDCWVFTGAPSTRGYGRISVDRKARFAHVVIYKLLVGPVPEGLELDHLCRNHACVRPDHLEPVTHAENIRRGAAAAPEIWGQGNAQKTHCPYGHPYDEENTNLGIQGGVWVHRRCRTCTRARDRARKRKR